MVVNCDQNSYQIKFCLLNNYKIEVMKLDTNLESNNIGHSNFGS